MTQLIYHGDPDREHYFWVYPKYKSLQNTQWDAYDPFDICNNFTLVDATHCTDTQMYQCNGHSDEWYGDIGGCSHPTYHKNINMTQLIYHGDPDREHYFWVYPKYKSLQNTQWDAYDPFELCNNFTLVDATHCGDTQVYRCNGHSNEWYGDNEYSYPIFHGDPDRDHHFWVYPKNEPLINSRWDAYDPTRLCDNFTLLGLNDPDQIRTYKCNGHTNECYGVGGVLHLTFRSKVSSN